LWLPLTLPLPRVFRQGDEAGAHSCSAGVISDGGPVGTAGHRHQRGGSRTPNSRGAVGGVS
jgi:hypothetical protein